MAMFELLSWKKTEWDFVGKRRIAFAFSGALVVLGLLAAVQMARGKARLGIDFSGGLSVRAAVGARVEADQLRAAFGQAGDHDVTIQQVDGSDGRRWIIRLPLAPAGGAGGSAVPGEDRVRAVLQGAAAGATVTIEGVQAVGPAVGKQLQRQAGWATFASLLLIMLYIWIRFEIRFGVAAAIATAHDVLAILGVMWVLGHEFDMLMVTALLTLAGYSLTDTVVVYDRIRENLRLYPALALDVTVNRSINEILSRTALTSLTLLPLIALLVYGSPVTYSFALALFLGILVGTYSSWYVAAPILVEWEQYRRRKRAEAAAQRFARPR